MTDTVLARELTGLPDEIRRVPAPPIPALGFPYAMRVAKASDAALVAEWMNRPHLVAAWEYDWPVWRWRRHLQAQLDGAYSLPLIGALLGHSNPATTSPTPAEGSSAHGHSRGVTVTRRTLPFRTDRSVTL